MLSTRGGYLALLGPSAPLVTIPTIWLNNALSRTKTSHPRKKSWSVRLFQNPAEAREHLQEAQVPKRQTHVHREAFLARTFSTQFVLDGLMEHH